MMARMSGILRAQLSTAAARHNVAEVRRVVGSEVEVCAVVKANAYGHGLDQMVPCFTPLVDRFAVTLPPTALRVRELGWSGPILVFFRAAGFAHSDAVADMLEKVARAEVTVTIAGQDDVELLESVALRLARPIEAHLKVDTGMTRSGILATEATALVRRVRASVGIKLTGIYTQIASADGKDLTSARAQLITFEQVLASIGETEILTIHAANSAATVALPESRYRMVRPGLALYGGYPSPEMARPLDLQPILRLTAQLLEIKTVPAGSRTGYGLTHTFPTESKIGLVSVGYADGYPRSLGGKATMAVRGQRVPICGRVSMDQVVVDLTEVQAAQIGDEVEVIASDSSSTHSLEGLARLADTVPYEIACGLGPRVERRLVSS